jgi:multiple sugar transport system permease protein
MGSSGSVRNAIKSAVKYCAVGLIVFLVSVPFIWMVLSSLKTDQELCSWPPHLFPRHPTIEYFKDLETQMNISMYMKNSLLVAIGTIGLCLFLSTMGAYALTRFRFRGRQAIANIILLAYTFPSMLLAIPLFIIFSKIGMSNKLWSLVLAHTTFSFPFMLWFLWGFFKTIPIHLEEAAMLDGATRLQVIRHVVLPISLPGIVAVAIFAFIVSWNDYLFALVMISSERLKTVPLALSSLAGLETMSWGIIMAAGVIISIPPIIFFIFVQKHMFKGFGVGVIE